MISRVHEQKNCLVQYRHAVYNAKVCKGSNFMCAQMSSSIYSFDFDRCMPPLCLIIVSSTDILWFAQWGLLSTVVENSKCNSLQLVSVRIESGQPQIKSIFPFQTILLFLKSDWFYFNYLIYYFQLSESLSLSMFNKMEKSGRLNHFCKIRK